MLIHSKMAGIFGWPWKGICLVFQMDDPALDHQHCSVAILPLSVFWITRFWSQVKYLVL